MNPHLASNWLTQNRCLGKFVRAIREEKGSASVEFVLLAVPLFLPILLYLSAFSQLSSAELNARSLVREVVRAYVTSQNLNSAEERANFLLKYGAQRLGFTANEISSMKLNISCSSRNCLEPGERVEAELEMRLIGANRTVRVSAQQYVSPWQ